MTERQQNLRVRTTNGHQSVYRADELLDRGVYFLRLPDVKAITGLSKTSIYELIRENRFPSPVRVGVRAVAWVRSEVDQWAKERVDKSRSTEEVPGRRSPRPVPQPTVAAEIRRFA